MAGYKNTGIQFETMFPLGKRRFPASPEDENLPEYYGGDADLDLGPVSSSSSVQARAS